MPCLYAHDTFGQKVRKLLPKEMQECIATYEDQFQLGLQGPDFLFYFRPLSKNPVNGLGHKIHKKPGAFYLKKVLPIVRRKGKYSPESAYLLGFLCHFMLDSHCHPYVEKKEKETRIGHVDLEGEFDKFLMKRDGMRPETYPLWRHIKIDRLTVNTLFYLYPWVKKRHIIVSLWSFKFCKWLLTAQNPVKKQCLIYLMKGLGLYEKLGGHYLWDETKEGSEPVSLGLFIRYEEEIEKTVAMEKMLWDMMGDSKKNKFSPRLSVNFSGKEVMLKRNE